MYEAYYGLRSKPFELQPDPDYLYMSPGHDRVYTHLRYAIREAKGLAVITGEIGSGKTTLLKLLMRAVPEEADVALVSNTMVAPTQFLKIVCREFGLEPRARDKADVLAAFGALLREKRAANRRVILIVDEAQNLPPRTIEEVRLLSNLEANREQLLQILLVGQPELRAKLRQRGMEQVLQRVSVHCHLESLGLGEVTEYVRHRLQVAGAPDPELFEPEALRAIFRYSRGIPRLVNILCDTALVFGYGDEKPKIDEAVIEEVAEARRTGDLLDDQDPVTRSGHDKAPWKDVSEQIARMAERVAKLEEEAAVARSERQRLKEWVQQFVRIIKQAQQSPTQPRITPQGH
ncbi:MAG: AAA family ATPase [Deltaproteobacteria bacterium]|nr:AAA family ATPase [Deltaproteobacteria bacterium]